MAELPVTRPHDCGLALALPMDIAAIETALAGGAYADYVGRAASARSAMRIWEDLGFQRVAAMAGKLAQDARHLGVTVIEGASLRDVRQLFATCPVVTIVAHWRGPEIDAADVRLDPALVAERVETDPSPTARLLRTGLPDGWSARVRKEHAPSEQKSRLAELIDRRLRLGPALVAPPEGVAWHMDATTLRHFNRTALDAWWPEAFAAGNRLELADGLHAPEAVAACVDGDWKGIADLSNCQSAQLIDGIKLRRDDRVVISNEHEANPISRMALLRTVYDLLGSGARNYVEVRKALASALVAEARGYHR